MSRGSDMICYHEVPGGSVSFDILRCLDVRIGFVVFRCLKVRMGFVIMSCLEVRYHLISGGE